MEKDIQLSLINSYQSKLNSYDEVIDQNGQVKPYWSNFFKSIEALGLQELEIRNQEIINQLKENGVTYNVYGNQSGMKRPWILDPIPFLIHQSEWQVIEKGIKQRAHLLDLIYKDIYGPQLLIKNFIIPAELVYDNSGYLLPCFDIKDKLKNKLILYACDMARGPDGKMWLLDNRTQSPSGAGYALENRSVLSKIIPEFNRHTHRSRLSPFFTHLQQTVATLGNISNESPNVVFLTPGPGNETYFEHVYLSNYLGYTLVQGTDLLVRDGFVWLKSIDQLQRVDVILKRVDDEWCDPLELKTDSLLGIPGLLQVMRLGNVSVINSPGASVVENYGLLAFMENACQFLLNEPLLLNSVATWWCGQEKELNYVLENLPKLIIKKTNRKQGFRSIYGKTLSSAEIDELKKLIRSSPKDFVAQEEVSLSTTPSYIDGKIEPRYAAIRTYLVSDGEDYKVMQGGLTRSSPIKDKFVISNQVGGLSKDTWIVTDNPPEHYEKIVIRKNSQGFLSNSLTSRNAENLFWVGRLSERSLALSSLFRKILNHFNENLIHKDGEHPEFLKELLKSLTHLSQTYPGFLDEENKNNLIQPTQELWEILYNKDRPGTLVYTLQQLLNTIHQVNDRWNFGTRKIIYHLDDSLAAFSACPPLRSNFNKEAKSLDKLYIRIFSFYGHGLETLSRDNGHYLFEAGKNIERILANISVLRSCFSFKSNPEDEHLLIEVVLEYHHLLASYRTLHKSDLNLSSALEMVLLDKHFPYTLAYLLDSLALCLEKLPKSNLTLNRLNKAEKSVLEASTKIKLIDTDTIIEIEATSQYRQKLDSVLGQVYTLISSVTPDLTSLYFNHTIHQSLGDTIEKSNSDEI